MEREDLFKKLESLAQLDTDAVHVYSEAMEHSTDEEVLEAFKRFQGEHGYHAEQLSEAIVRLGGEKPQLKVDVAGHIADWITSIRSLRGTEGALHAMKTAEHYHNRRYDEAATWDVGDEMLATLIGRFRDDEKRHLAFMEERSAKHAETGASK